MAEKKTRNRKIQRMDEKTFNRIKETLENQIRGRKPDIQAIARAHNVSTTTVYKVGKVENWEDYRNRFMGRHKRSEKSCKQIEIEMEEKKLEEEPEQEGEEQVEETKKPPKGLLDALRNIKEEDLHYGGTINVAEEEQCVAVEVSKYEKLITAKTILSMINRDVRWRMQAKKREELPDYTETVDEDFILRVLGLAYQEDKSTEQDDQGE